MSIQCDSCCETVPGFDTIRYGSMETGYRDLCSRCFNQEVAKLGGLNFEHVAFEPVEMRDAVGGLHRFHFRVHHLGDQMSLEAFELKEGAPGGYQFQILGEAEADLFGMGQLIERVRRTLAQQHLEKDDQFGLMIKDSLVRGRIAWDSDEDGRVPLLVIDGQEVSWEKFGRMVMGFEGWQFKFEIRDKSEEV
jgi:hypothetical protein